MQSWNAFHRSEKAKAFLFTYDRMKRYEGAWHLLEEPLFPGMIFLEYKEELPSDGESVSGLETDGVLLDSEMEQFLIELGGTIHHVPMSRGIIQNGIATVTEGPLEGKEDTIQKIDRHKRLARISGPSGWTAGAENGFWTGLEITSKN